MDGTVRPAAGDSASQVASKRRAKAARLEKSAAAFERGAQGEAETAAALALLDSSCWTVLHDTPWPGRRYANIDHVVVGTTGVFVIDSKSWSGRLDISKGNLRQNGYSRAREVSGAIEAADAVAALVPELDRSLVRSVLCFAGGNRPDGELPGVLVSGTDDLVAAITEGPQVLTATRIAEISTSLDLGLVRSWQPPSAADQPVPNVAVDAAPIPIPQTQTRPKSHRAETARGRRLALRAASLAAVVVGLAVALPNVLQR